MNPIEWSDHRLLEIDLMVRSGQHEMAKQTLFSLLSNGLPPRPLLATAAALFRRLGLSPIAVQILNPIVRPSTKKLEKAIASEKSEYAGALVRMGILSEAHRLLDEVSSSEYPRALLFRAFAHISQWNFEESEKPLLKYISLPNADSYEVMIAQVNLMMGFVFREDFDQAQPLIQELLENTKKSESFLLLANTLESAAEASIMMGDWGRAQNYLSEATSLLSSSDTIDAFLLRKWSAALELRKQPRSSQSMAAMKSCREEALKRKHWESVRDCDFQWAVAKKDSKLLEHLYFGTPHKGYRQKIEQTGLLDISKIKSKVIYKELGVGKKTQRLDIYIRQTKGGVLSEGDGSFLKPNQILHRLFQALGRDSYRPARLMELFDQIFPEENYFPQSSADKMRQCLLRLRKFFKKNKIGLQIKESEGFYRLEALPDYHVGIEQVNRGLASKEHSNLENTTALTAAFSSTSNSQITPQLEKYLNWWKRSANQKKPISCQEFSLAHDLSERTASRILRVLCELRLVEKSGAARATRYHFTKGSPVDKE